LPPAQRKSACKKVPTTKQLSDVQNDELELKNSETVDLKPKRKCVLKHSVGINAKKSKIVSKNKVTEK